MFSHTLITNLATQVTNLSNEIIIVGLKTNIMGLVFFTFIFWPRLITVFK